MAQFENVAHFGFRPSWRVGDKFCNDKNVKWGQNRYLCNDKNIYVMTKIGVSRRKSAEIVENWVKMGYF